MSKKKKILVALSIMFILVLLLCLATVIKNRNSNKKSVDIWHQIVIGGNSVGDYASNSISSSNTDNMLSAVVKLNSTLDDASFRVSKLSYLITGSDRKTEMDQSIKKIKDYNSKLKSALDKAGSVSNDLNSSDTIDLQSTSKDMKTVIDDMLTKIKFGENLSTEYYKSYEYPEELGDKLSEAKSEEEKKQQQEQQAKDDLQTAIKASEVTVNSFMSDYIRKDFAAMKSSMSSGYQNEFKFNEVEAGWSNSHPKSYRIISTKQDGDNYLVSLNTTYYSSYPDQNNNPIETENTATENYRVIKSDSGAYLVDGQDYGY